MIFVVVLRLIKVFWSVYMVRIRQFLNVGLDQLFATSCCHRRLRGRHGRRHLQVYCDVRLCFVLRRLQRLSAIPRAIRGIVSTLLFILVVIILVVIVVVFLATLAIVLLLQVSRLVLLYL